MSRWRRGILLNEVVSFKEAEDEVIVHIIPAAVKGQPIGSKIAEGFLN